jgi:cobyrinic acid a,c-diamide synthase
VLRRDPALTWRDRHLGLVPVIEQQAEVAAALERLGALIDRLCDLAAVTALARTAPATRTTGPLLPDHVADVRIAVAAGQAFSFSYPDNLEALRAAGAELVEFDPCTADRLPDGCTGLVAGGGFPEVHLDALAANTALLADVRRRVDDSLVVWAECGGLLWLGRALDGRAMAGVVATDGAMTGRLTLGYRAATTLVDTPIAPAGTELRGHEYHYSSVEPTGDALALSGRTGDHVAGFADRRLLASYLHLHLGARPDLAAHFVTRCVESLTDPRPSTSALRSPYAQ